MIYEFTNSLGRINYGLILGSKDGGGYVLMDKFSPNGKSKLPARYRFVTMADSKYVSTNGKRRVLPISTPVQWVHPELKSIAKSMAQDNAEEWVQVNLTKIMRRFP